MIAGIVAVRVAADAAPAVAPYWNPEDKAAAITLSGLGNRQATGSGAAWASVRGVAAHATGKWYAEVLIDANTLTHMVFGVATSAAALGSYVGGNAVSWGIHANANPPNTYTNGVATSAGSGTIAVGGRAYVAYDADSGKLWLGSSSLSGTWAGGGSPAAGTAPTYTVTPGTALHLALSLASSGQTCTLKSVAGENAGTIPSGFEMWAIAGDYAGAAQYWSPVGMAAGCVLSDGNKVLGGVGAGPHWARSERGRTTGKYRAQLVFDAMPGSAGVGLGFDTVGMGNYLGATEAGAGFWGNYGSNTRTYQNYDGTGVYGTHSGPIAAGDVVDLLVDMTAGKAWVRRNGVLLAGDPVAGTGATYTWTPGVVVVYLAGDAYQAGALLRIRALASEMTGTPVAGFTDGWSAD